VSRAPRVAVGVASAANNEAVSADWVARLVVEPGFEAAHGRIAVLFATRHRVALNVAIGVPVANLVSVRGQAFRNLRTKNTLPRSVNDRAYVKVHVKARTAM